MSNLIDNLVHEISESTGTGTLTLNPQTGWRTFYSAFDTGTTFRYVIRNRDALEWEAGKGTLSAPSTLSRETIVASSNGGSAVDFTEGVKEVVCDVYAEAMADYGDTPSFNGTDLSDTATDPDANGELRRNGDDVKVYSGGAVRDISKMLQSDGSVPLTSDWDIGDGRAILTDKIRARDGDGLRLHDDNGNGIFVEDGGNTVVGPGTAANKFEVHDVQDGDDVEFIIGGIGTSPGAYDASWTLDSTGMKFGHNSENRDLQLQTNNTTRFTITGAGGIVINSAIDLEGNLFLTDRNTLFRFENKESGHQWEYYSGGSAGDNAYAIYDRTNETYAWVLDPNDRVAIGMQFSPSAKFQIEGDGGDIVLARDSNGNNMASLGSAGTLEVAGNMISSRWFVFRARSDSGNKWELINPSDDSFLGIYDRKNTQYVFEMQSGGGIKMPALPTSDPAVADELWNDGGTVKISSG